MAITRKSSYTIGRSVRGRAIKAYRLRTGNSRVSYLVIGCMHGDEPAGTHVVERLLRVPPPPGVTMWLVPTINPDGLARGTRVNAHHVDLNRNFAAPDWKFQGQGTDTYSGPRPESEPETRATVKFLDDLHPLTIVSMHQPLQCVDFSGGNPEVTRWLARHLDLPARHLVTTGGTMTGWYNHRFKQRTAVTVELTQPVSVRLRRKVAAVLLDHAAFRAK